MAVLAKYCSSRLMPKNHPATAYNNKMMATAYARPMCVNYYTQHPAAGNARVMLLMMCLISDITTADACCGC